MEGLLYLNSLFVTDSIFRSYHPALPTIILILTDKSRLYNDIYHTHSHGNDQFLDGAT